MFRCHTKECSVQHICIPCTFCSALDLHVDEILDILIPRYTMFGSGVIADGCAV